MPKMAVILPAQQADAPALAEIMNEMDRYYGETSGESESVKIANITSALFGQPPAAYCLLAWQDSELIGFACYSYLWPAIMSTKSLYLKELFVGDRHRHTGIGGLLMAELISVARDNGCSRMEWTTDIGNMGAQAFYERHGFKTAPSKIFYRENIPSRDPGP
jgi:GNAT superfamily N-acetyltransferase